MRLVLAVLLLAPSTLAFVAQQPSSVRLTSRYQTPQEHEEDPAFKYYNRDEEDEIVTQEMLYRDLLQDPKVKKRRRGGGSGYRTMDNRDVLPFVVKVVTPDPYTPADTKKEQARANTEQARKKSKPLKKTDLMGGIAASIYSQKDDGSLERVLGEFSLDKSTNCGDLLEVGDREYEVQRARCQYK